MGNVRKPISDDEDFVDRHEKSPHFVNASGQEKNNNNLHYIKYSRISISSPCIEGLCYKEGDFV